MSDKEKKNRQEDSPFREWLSDNLRYLVLAIAILLIIVLIVMITALMRQEGTGKTDSGASESGPDIIIMSEKITESETQTEAGAMSTEKATEKLTEKQNAVTEKQTEKQSAVTEKLTEKTDVKAAEKQPSASVSKTTGKETAATEKTTEKQTSQKSSASNGVGTSDLDNVLAGQTEDTTPSAKENVILAGGSSSASGNTSSITNLDTGRSVGTYSGHVTPKASSDENAASGGESAGMAENTGSGEESSGSTDQKETDSQEVYIPETPETPETPAPTTATILSACYIRSYPDYGDNIIASLYGGETVTYYGIEEGWAKIEVNGITGYIGPRFIG